MKCCLRRFRNAASTFFVAALVIFTAGCATQKIDWNARVGNYSYDQAVMEYGPPDKYAKLEDGTVVAEWLTRRGYSRAYISPGYYSYYGPYCGPLFPTIVDTSSPDYYLRLTFGPDSRLKTWKNFAK